MDKIEVRLDIEAEDRGPEGTYAGDPCALDKETCKYIHTELNKGNQWAWCVVIVTARFREYQGRAVLGGCSYKDEVDFKKDGYWQTMRQEAIDDLKLQMETIIERSGAATAARFAVERAEVSET